MKPTCLSCHQNMEIVREGRVLDHITYDACENCGALWIKKEELAKLTLQSKTIGKPDFSGIMKEVEPNWWAENPNIKRMYELRHCLECKDTVLVKMHLMGESNLILDACPLCGGVWLDGGELDQMNDYLKWIDHGAKSSSFGKFLKHVKDQARLKK